MKYFAYPMRGSMLALKTILLSVFCLILAAPALAQRAFDVQLWQKKAPNSNALGDTAYVKVFLPEEKRATGRAVVICPGGGPSTMVSVLKCSTSRPTQTMSAP